MSPPLAACALMLVASAAANAQVIPGSLSAAAEFGTGMYIGEFNSFQYQGSLTPSFGLDFAGLLRYDFAQQFSLLAEVGYMRLNYDISDYNRQRYGPFFFGATGATVYPGSTVALTGRNHININKYMVMARSHFNADSRFVPYFTLGLGLINFKAVNDSGQPLPTNLTGDYERTVMVMPVGGGAEYHFSDRVGLYLQALFYVNSTDYLDGYAHYLDYDSGETGPGSGPGQIDTPPDYFGTLGLGLTLTLYHPETYVPEPPPPAAEPSGEEEPPPADSPRVQEQPPGPRMDTAPAPPDSVPSEQRRPSPQEPQSADSTLDSDGDGLTDRDERNRYMTDPYKADTDGDNLSDADEVRKYNTSPNNRDTDGDGLTDGAEAIVYNTNPLAADSDGDGLRDGQEVRLYRTDPMEIDTDHDQLGDGVEVTRLFTDPLNPDSDHDGVPDGTDQCPNLAGDPLNSGCPRGMAPADYSERLRKTGPLKGLPATPLAGDRTDFSGIYFRVNSDDFDLSRPETVRNLSNMLNYMKQCDSLGVVIEGHTSSEGSASRNQILSRQRAQRVRKWLLDNGVEPSKILGAVGYGSLLPRVPEPQEGNVPAPLLEQIRKQNRRITTLVQKPCK